jgi:PAS domain S-box-containing protein
VGGPEGAATEVVKILVVDDQAINLRYLNRVLSHPDQAVFLAESGPMALELVAQHEFAVVLLDVSMPGMDGFEVAARVRQTDVGRLTPILFVTASGDNVDWLFRAYSVGGVDFLAKPLDQHVVRGKVAVFAELFRQKVQLRQQALQLRDAERRERTLERAQLKLEHERRYLHLAESLPNVVWIAGLDCQFEYVNQRWLDITASAVASAMGRGWLDALHPEDREPILRQWLAAIELGADLEGECRLRTREGAYRWYLCRALPERDEAGAVVRWVGSFTDVDQQKKAHEQSRSVIALRDEFIAVASHELRTPLTALRLELDRTMRSIEKTSGGAHPEPLVDPKVSAIDRQVNRLTILVNALLDVSRITTGQLVLHRESFDLVEGLARLVGDFDAAAAAAGCELRFSGPAPIHGQWDRTRLDQAVGNLLTNAIKYAPTKPIEIGVQRAGDSVSISVVDRGIGIEPEHVARIFERFERAVPSRNFGGLGLGLWLSRQIALAHGGTIDVSSRVGQGSTFRLTLPVSC